jgi:glycosyltransferase involved in cell wall biosynthesis
MRRILFVTYGCYLDSSNGASVASRAMMEALARRGYLVEAVSGVYVEHGSEVDAGAWLEGLGTPFESIAGGSWTADMRGLHSDVPPHFRLTVGGVLITLASRATAGGPKPGDEAYEDVLRLYEAAAERLQPDVLVNYGGGRLTREVRSRARSRGVAIVFPVHNFGYREFEAFAGADAVIVPSRFAADNYRKTLGLDCTVLPNIVDLARVQVTDRDPRYLTFVNPSYEKGVYVFARIADELGRRRPDIPILVVEGRASERTLADCGLDLRDYGNIFLMGHTPDPRKFWGVTRAALLPSLWWENQPLVAIEAMVNGIPVIGSDRGGIPEALGEAGVILPLPERLTAATRFLPTAEEVGPWVEAILRLWEDEPMYREHSRRARSEARRWDPEILEQQYDRFFNGLRPRTKALAAANVDRSDAVVLVPHLDGIRWECEEGLRELERAGVRVVRRAGSSAIDVARNQMASDAVHDGAGVILFIDADMGFQPSEALGLLARPELVVAGIYAKKNRRDLASRFAEEVAEVVLGVGAPGLYPLKYAAAGFLRIRCEALRLMVERLCLPLCNKKWGRGCWPFFQPMIIADEADGQHYLGEDWAFSHRLRLAGITPMGDTSIRLWHYGHYPFGWEEAGTDRARYETYLYRIQGSQESEGR